MPKNENRRDEFTAENFRKVFPDITFDLKREAYIRGFEQGLLEGQAQPYFAGPVAPTVSPEVILEVSSTVGPGAVRPASIDTPTDDITAETVRKAFPDVTAELEGNCFLVGHEQGFFAGLFQVEAERMRKARAYIAENAVSKPAPVIAHETTKVPAMSPEEKLKHDWDSSASLRAEFGDDYEAYKAFHEALDRGLVKIYKQA